MKHLLWMVLALVMFIGCNKKEGFDTSGAGSIEDNPELIVGTWKRVNAAVHYKPMNSDELVSKSIMDESKVYYYEFKADNTMTTSVTQNGAVVASYTYKVVGDNIFLKNIATNEDSFLIISYSAGSYLGWFHKIFDNRVYIDNEGNELGIIDYYQDDFRKLKST